MHAGKRLFTCCVDIKYLRRVHVRKCGDKLRQQVARAGIAMWLEEDVHMFIAARPGSAQGRDNLCGVVAVIIDDSHTPDHALHLETPIHAAEIGQTGNDLIRLDLQLYGNRYRSSCI